nr:carotenoid oxygenase family protein [Candidatus Microthrix sp.]
MDARAHRWRFNLRTGQTTEAPTSERCSEFSMINGQHAGRRHRYSYNALGVPGMFAFNGLLKHDLDAGTEEVLEAPPGVFLSEAPMAPRDNSTAEDDGYLLTFVSDVPNDRSECWVLDASCPSDGPLARISLPERISSGTHSTWAPAT